MRHLDDVTLDSWAHNLSSDRLRVKTQTSTRPASPSNLLLPDEETESQGVRALSQGSRLTDGRCQGFLFALLPPEGQAGGGEAGLPGTPPLLSSLTSCPVASSGLRLWGLWKHLRVSWFLYQQAIVWEPSLSFNSGCRLLPSSSPERMGQSPHGPCPEGSLACQGGSSHPAPASPANPVSYAPSPSSPHPLPTTLAITENAKSFCLSSPLTQAHLGFICLDFPFPFLRNHQSPAHLSYHKESWGPRASSESPWEELVRKTGDPAPR